MSMAFFNIGYSVLLKEKNMWKLALGYIKCPEIRGFLEISHSCFHQKFNIIFFKTQMFLYKRCFFGKFPQTQRTKARIKIRKEKKNSLDLWTNFICWEWVYNWKKPSQHISRHVPFLNTPRRSEDAQDVFLTSYVRSTSCV